MSFEIQVKKVDRPAMIIRSGSSCLPVKDIGHVFDSHQIEQLFYAFFITVIEHRLDKGVCAQIFFCFGIDPPEKRAVFLDEFLDFGFVRHASLSVSFE
jgi:hypothetical protein